MFIRVFGLFLCALSVSERYSEFPCISKSYIHIKVSYIVKDCICAQTAPHNNQFASTTNKRSWYRNKQPTFCFQLYIIYINIIFLMIFMLNLKQTTRTALYTAIQDTAFSLLRYNDCNYHRRLITEIL